MGVVGQSKPRPLYPRKREPVTIVIEAGGGVPGPVWTGAENLVLPTGIRSQDHPARSLSLNRLRYGGPNISLVQNNNKTL